MSVRIPALASIVFALSGCFTDGETGDKDTGDDGAESCACDASISKRAASGFVSGATGTWEVVVDWQGAEYCNFEALCFTDVLPEGQSLASSSGGLDCDDSDGVVTCCATDFDPAESFSEFGVKLEVDLASTGPGELENCASLEINDAYPENNSDCATVWVEPAPEFVDLDLSKTVTDPGYFTAGGAGEFAFEVSNNGTGDAAGVSVTDVLPDGFSMNDQQTGDWFCTGDDAAPETVTCTYLGVLGAGAAESFALKVELDLPWEYEAVGQNCADVDLKDVSDVNYEDNSSCVEFDIVVPAEECGNCTDDDGDGRVDEDCEYELEGLYTADDEVDMYVNGVHMGNSLYAANTDTFTVTLVGGDVPHYIAAHAYDLGGIVSGYRAHFTLDGVTVAQTGDGSFWGSNTDPGTGWETSLAGLSNSYTTCNHSSTSWMQGPSNLHALGTDWIWFGTECDGITKYDENWIVHELQVCPSSD
jgi:uncharacterized repeat protein (TIGR01451 family)